MLKINELLQAYSIGYDTQDVNTIINHDFKINVSNIEIDAKQGDMLNIPRWIAQTLELEKHAEIQELNMGTELNQSISKENFQSDELSHLTPDFYIKLNGYMSRQSDKEYDKLQTMLVELIRIRLRKIIPLANSTILSAELSNKLTIEERVLYNTIYKKSKELRDLIVRNKK